MSQNMEETPLREVAILTRAVENVFRKLIRLLIGWMSLVKLQEMLRIVFVEEAERKLKKDNPGKNISLTNLALLTGLDTRTLTKIIAEKRVSPPLHEKERFLRDITQEGTVLDFWATNQKYVTENIAKPRTLSIKGNYPSFESLVKEISPSRGVTYSSILKNLLYSKCVEMNSKKDRVKLLNRIYMPFDFSVNTAQLEISLATVGNLIGTFVHNFETTDHLENAFFQRASWSFRFNREEMPQLRSELRNHLENAEKGAVTIMEKYEENIIHENQVTGGVGIFYFEEELD